MNKAVAVFDAYDFVANITNLILLAGVIHPPVSHPVGTASHPVGTREAENHLAETVTRNHRRNLGNKQTTKKKWRK
jgi:hypothetical protein